MTKEEAKLVLDNARPQTKEIDRQFYDDEDLNNALDIAIKALEQQKPLEKFENVKDHICKLADDYKCWDNRLSHEESLELCNILKQQSDDCVSRASVKELFQEGCVMGMYDFLGIDDLPPVIPTQSKWHLVKDELPRKFSFVNCTCHSLIDDREDWVIETCYFPQYPNSPYSDWGNIPMLNNGECEVIAWMYRDIPKPYKEKRGSENGSN